MVDKLSKYAHFMALSHPYTTITVAQCYLDNVFKHHGWPRTILKDMDVVFLSNFERVSSPYIALSFCYLVLITHRLMDKLR